MRVYDHYHFNCGEAIYTCENYIRHTEVCPLLQNEPEIVFIGEKEFCLEAIDAARNLGPQVFLTTCPNGSTISSYNKYDEETNIRKKCNESFGCLDCNLPSVVENGGGTVKGFVFKPIEPVTIQRSINTTITPSTTPPKVPVSGTSKNNTAVTINEKKSSIGTTGV